MEYRVEQHAAKLREQLGALRAVEFDLTTGTTGVASQLDRVGDVAVTRGRNSGVECQLPKLDVTGSNPVARSVKPCQKGRC